MPQAPVLSCRAKSFGGHRRLAVRRELDAVGSDEALHPVGVVLQAVLVQDGCGKAEVLVQEVPAKGCDVFGGRRLFEMTYAFVEGR